MSAAFPARARFHAVNNCVSWSGRCAWKETNLEVHIIEYCKIGFSFVRARSSRAVRLATLLDGKYADVRKGSATIYHIVHDLAEVH